MNASADPSWRLAAVVRSGPVNRRAKSMGIAYCARLAAQGLLTPKGWRPAIDLAISMTLFDPTAEVAMDQLVA
jgi:hypothetical protein